MREIDQDHDWINLTANPLLRRNWERQRKESAMGSISLIWCLLLYIICSLLIQFVLFKLLNREHLFTLRKSHVCLTWSQFQLLSSLFGLNGMEPSRVLPFSCSISAASSSSSSSSSISNRDARRSLIFIPGGALAWRLNSASTKARWDWRSSRSYSSPVESWEDFWGVVSSSVEKVRRM